MQKVFNPLYQIMAPLLRLWLHNSITGKTIKGTNLKLYYDRSQHLGFLGKRYIDYEKEFCAIVLGYVKQDDLVLEIGSNIGQYSLRIAEKIGANGKLICVEPDSDNFAFLSFNTIINRCDNVERLNMAISNQEGTTTFYKDTITGGRMGSLIKAYSGSHYKGKSEVVRTTTLTQLIQKYGIPAFVKVDVEGAENLVFSDSHAIDPRTTYLVEVRAETKHDIFSMFTSAGFSVFLLERNLEKIESAENLPGFGNLIIRFESVRQ